MSGSNGSGAKIVLAVVLTAAACAAVYQFKLKDMNSSPAPVGNSAPEKSEESAPSKELAPTGAKVLKDGKQTIAAKNAWKGWGFSLDAETNISCVVKGIRNADKGVDCYLIPKKNIEDFKPGQPVNMVEGFKGLAVKVYNRRGKVRSGDYVLVVVNTSTETMEIEAVITDVGDSK